MLHSMWLQRVGQDLVTEQQQLVFGEFALRLFLHPSPALLCNAGVCVYVCVCVCVGSGDGLIPAGCTSHFPCQLGFSQIQPMEIIEEIEAEGREKPEYLLPSLPDLGSSISGDSCISCKALVPKSSPLMPQLPPGGLTLGSETTPYLSAIASFQSASRLGLSSSTLCVTTSLCQIASVSNVQSGFDSPGGNPAALQNRYKHKTRNTFCKHRVLI